ncbi:cystathionine gamma-synthase family protein [Marinigracilibium pacificum]|uniref:Cystathionine gamma-synthase family protein n=1 Tax=Marinigracilibium pacificum TaxID=2729599 RepID=A0A848IR92_9BACT|nr:cystathionine gamma-synthase family protein [Marinigracilibium pacificum]NMM46983.1 cystathionine gamma-synthase family protein [Marinigracilibium pacificum]
MKPESLMMSYGYKPELSEGALKCPIFLTSTFVFKNAEEGKSFFEVAYGLREKKEGEELGLIYSRLNNPDLEILENRLTLWDNAEDAAVFESGMSAISTSMLTFLNPGDTLLYSNPLYGGSHHFINHVLTRFGINIIDFNSTESKEDIYQKIEDANLSGTVKMVYVETPGNPTNSLIDLKMCAELCSEFSTEERKSLLVVDNTYLGPLWQNPLNIGADLIVYSATKYIGGHSDVIAGAVLGSKELMAQIKGMRTFLGNMAGPWTGWLLMRSLETLKMRMETQAFNAERVAAFLNEHPKVEKVYYLGDLTPEKDPEAYRIYKSQCKSPGAMISFDIKGGEKEAFKFLNSLKLIKLAVSLGSTESLAEHPFTMTHADVSSDVKNSVSITEKLVRISIGVENPDDIISDINQALEKVKVPDFSFLQ